MNFKLVYKNFLMSAYLVATLTMSSVASAGLINSDFSDELNGWSADYSYFDGAQEYFYEPVVDFGNFAENFSTGLNSVTLSTSFDGVNEYFGLYFFQEFEVAVDSFELSLGFESIADYAYVTLVDENFDLVHDFMSNGLSVDISSFVGSFLSLEFGIEDENFIYDDYLTVSNIFISEKPSQVPEPSSFAIFALALLVLKSRSVNRFLSSSTTRK